MVDFLIRHIDFPNRSKYDFIIPIFKEKTMQPDKAERITITLPPEMLTTIKNKVKSGAYGSTSELIREAMRLWQKNEDVHQEKLSLIRNRLTKSVQSGDPVPLDDAFKKIGLLHQHRMKMKSDEKI